MLLLDIFNDENAFPFFNWKIFHTRPDKYWDRDFIYIHEIDGQVFDPPIDILDMKEKFPDIEFYTFTRKILDFSSNMNTPKGDHRLKAINENLTRNHNKVRWELVQLTFDVIDFYKTKTYIKRKQKGYFVSNRNGGSK